MLILNIYYKEKTVKYQWYKDGSPLSEGAGENKIWESYVSVPLSDPGTYWVVINDDPSMKSDDFVYFIPGCDITLEDVEKGYETLKARRPVLD